MRKRITFLLLVSFLVAANAQDNHLKKQTYFRFGWAMPTWKYFGWDDKSDWNESIKRTGGMFEAGAIYMPDALQFADGMGLGIHVDFLSVTYNRFRDTDTDYNNHFVFMGSKIGPSFSYSPASKLVLDVYFKFNPVWAAGSLVVFNNEPVEDRIYAGFLKIKYSVGFNIRYGIAMLGLEFNPGSVKLREFDKEEREFTDTYMGNTNAGDRTPVPGVNFTVGLSF